MRKILMIGNDLSVKGGITTVINQILDYEWKKENIELKFIPTYIEKNNFMKVIFFIIAYIRIFFYLIFWKPDKIHIHMSYKGSFIRASFIQKLSKSFKINIIVHLHGSEFKKWFNSLDRKKQEKVKAFIKETDTFIVLGKRWNDVIQEIEPKARIRIINNATPIPENSTYYNIPFTILFLGVLIKRKGISDLIDSIFSLKIILTP